MELRVLTLLSPQSWRRERFSLAYLNLMREVREVRESLEAGTFAQFRAQFKAERARGV